MDRRSFLQTSGGLVIGFSLWGCKDDPPAKPAARPAEAAPPTTSQINAWVRIGSDDTVTLITSEAEMGQGVMTALPMILADELGAEWKTVRTELAPSDPKAYGRQSTGGSTTIRTGFDKLRRAGAAAREMLVAAAAAQWGVEPASCAAAAGAVTHQASGRSARFGALAAAAAQLPVPAEPALRPDGELALVGTSVPRLELRDKVTGRAVFGIDVKVPGMVYASVERPPTVGGAVAAIDDAAARAVPGVRDVIQVPTGVAVVAEHTWAALEGRRALKVEWDAGAWAELSTDNVMELCRAAVAAGGVQARNDGDADKALRKARARVEAEYEVPYLAHAPMEPLGCTAHVRADGAEIWVATQAQTQSHTVVGEITGLAPENIQVHSTLLGGGFGRRSQTDFVADAVHVSKAIGKPVKVQWTREDDVRGGWYRPVAYNRLRGGVDKDGWPVAWHHDIASPSILEPLMPLERGIDGTSVEGASNLPYAIPNVRVTYAKPELPVSLWFWRSVGSSQNGYVTECFLDELARAGRKDPVELRRRLLADHPRHAGVLELAADKAGWGAALPEGVARGVAVHESFGSFVAQVAEVSLDGDTPRVHRVVCAVDCGKVVHPDLIAAQMESGIVYGLSAALYSRIDLKDGRAVQGNFDTYRVLRLPQMPKVEVHIVPSTEPHGGIGEPGLPPIAPAVCNALLALTGTPRRKLPLVG